MFTHACMYTDWIPLYYFRRGYRPRIINFWIRLSNRCPSKKIEILVVKHIHYNNNNIIVMCIKTKWIWILVSENEGPINKLRGLWNLQLIESDWSTFLSFFLSSTHVREKSKYIIETKKEKAMTTRDKQLILFHFPFQFQREREKKNG